MSELTQLKLDAKGLIVLYVEDNDSLRENAAKLLSKIFETVYAAEDGVKGLEDYKAFHPDIVITDIKMPNMSGLELAAHIREISLDTKILIMSAFDDKENLHKAIDIGVSSFLAKPVAMKELVKELRKIVKEITDINNKNIFLANIKNVFNYQSSMVLMMDESKPVVANQILLDFFHLKDVEEFINKYTDFGTLFLEHDGFLYNTKDKNWFDEIQSNEAKLYNVKIKSAEDELKHFILKYQTIPDKQGYGVLSLDDITELNILKLYDETQNHDKVQDSSSILKLLEVIKNNAGKLELHNYYKGLSITNSAVVTDIKEESIVLQTSFLQEKAVQFEKKTLMVSELLPHVVECSELVKIGFESQNIEFKNVHFVQESAIMRKTVRLMPEENTKVNLFIADRKYQGEIKVEDISLDGVKLNLSSLPAGLQNEEKVIVDFVFYVNKKPLLLNVHAKMFKKIENRHSFSLVFLFEFEKGEKNVLVKYIANRQMRLIKEFKGLENG